MSRKLFMLCCILFFNQVATAEAVLQSLKVDARAKIVGYNPNQIYPLKTSYLTSTDIVFGKDETITDYHFGDGADWEAEAVQNHFYLKARKVDAAGNLNINTNRNSYHFTLSVGSGITNIDEYTFILQFAYPKHSNAERKIALMSVNVPSNICQDKHLYNLQYSYTGNREQAPIRACDDGLFTYLLFSKQTELPAIFSVLPDRKEEVVNYRMEQGWLVVERVAKAFTLRNGDIVTSVYNDKYIGSCHTCPRRG